MPQVIESVIPVRRNADLIATIAPLWIAPSAKALDLTYGRGLWWARYRPQHLVTNDLDHSRDTDCHYDYRDLPLAWTDTYDLVAFDPPYTAKGGRTTSGIAEMDDRYGLVAAPATPQLLVHDICEGLQQAARVLRPGGILLLKSADFISSGKYQPVHLDLLVCAVSLGLEIVDEYVHHSGRGPQPTRNRDGTLRRQVHSRRAHSYLTVFRK